MQRDGEIGAGRVKSRGGVTSNSRRPSPHACSHLLSGSLQRRRPCDRTARIELRTITGSFIILTAPLSPLKHVQHRLSPCQRTSDSPFSEPSTSPATLLLVVLLLLVLRGGRHDVQSILAATRSKQGDVCFESPVIFLFSRPSLPLLFSLPVKSPFTLPNSSILSSCLLSLCLNCTLLQAIILFFHLVHPSLCFDLKLQLKNLWGDPEVRIRRHH